FARTVPDGQDFDPVGLRLDTVEDSVSGNDDLAVRARWVGGVHRSHERRSFQQLDPLKNFARKALGRGGISVGKVGDGLFKLGRGWVRPDYLVIHAATFFFSSS